MEKLMLSEATTKTLKTLNIKSDNKKDVLNTLLKIKDKTNDVLLAIVELSKDTSLIASEVPQNALYKGQTIDASGICHNEKANEVLIKNILFVDCAELLEQAKALAIAPQFDPKERVEIRQKINQDLVSKLQKIIEKTPNVTFLRISFVYTSEIAKGKSVTKIFFDTTPFCSEDGNLLIEKGSTYKLMLSQISNGDLSIGRNFYEKHKSTWGEYPTSPHNYLSIKGVTPL